MTRRGVGDWPLCPESRQLTFGTQPCPRSLLNPHTICLASGNALDNIPASLRDADHQARPPHS